MMSWRYKNNYNRTEHEPGSIVESSKIPLQALNRNDQSIKGNFLINSEYRSIKISISRRTTEDKRRLFIVINVVTFTRKIKNLSSTIAVLFYAKCDLCNCISNCCSDKEFRFIINLNLNIFFVILSWRYHFNGNIQAIIR